MTKSRHIKADERLSILRAADQFRSWDSVDDRRFCIVCDRKFNGRQISITRRRHGGYDLHCPTAHCKSLPHQWVYPGNPLTSESAYADWWRALGGEPPPLAPARAAFSRA
jgi:hypothetical protein